MDIYETAYQEQVERIRARQGKAATLFLTRRVERNPDFWKDEGLIRAQSEGPGSGGGEEKGGIGKMLELARKKKEEKAAPDGGGEADGDGDGT